jgi:glycosyltransferase involved in cell wall biosynthesis
VHLAALPGATADGRARSDLDGVVLHPLRRVLPARLLEWTATWALERLAREVSPDVVVERFYTFGGGALRAAHKLGIPTALEVNSPARPYPGSIRDQLDRLTLFRPIDRWRRRQLEWADAIYATSERLLPPALQDSTRVIVNGVDTNLFKPGPEVAATGPLRGVYVSSFRSWHGAEDLVEAVRLCGERGARVQVTCLGRGPRWDAAREAARAAALGDAIHFVGEVAHADVPGYLAQSDIGVAPFSPAEFSALELGWFWSPIKIFEYLAAGLPVVTADLVELRELLPGSVASFYRAGEPAGLAEALMDLEKDRQAVRKMSAAARQLAESRYTWDHQAADVDAVLQFAMERGARQPRTSRGEINP